MSLFFPESELRHQAWCLLGAESGRVPEGRSRKLFSGGLQYLILQGLAI